MLSHQMRQAQPLNGAVQQQILSHELSCENENKKNSYFETVLFGEAMKEIATR